jgi:hypothetical protein
MDVILDAAHDQGWASHVLTSSRQIRMHLGSNLPIVQERCASFGGENNVHVDLCKSVRQGLIPLYNPVGVGIVVATTQDCATLVLGFGIKPRWGLLLLRRFYDHCFSYLKPQSSRRGAVAGSLPLSERSERLSPHSAQASQRPRKARPARRRGIFDALCVIPVQPPTPERKVHQDRRFIWRHRWFPLIDMLIDIQIINHGMLGNNSFYI